MTMKVVQPRKYKRPSPAFTVYLDPDEKERAIKAAEKTGETLSGFIRRAMLKAVDEVLDGGGGT